MVRSVHIKGTREIESQRQRGIKEETGGFVWGRNMSSEETGLTIGDVPGGHRPDYRFEVHLAKYCHHGSPN